MKCKNCSSDLVRSKDGSIGFCPDCGVTVRIEGDRQEVDSDARAGLLEELRAELRGEYATLAERIAQLEAKKEQAANDTRDEKPAGRNGGIFGDFSDDDDDD